MSRHHRMLTIKDDLSIDELADRISLNKSRKGEFKAKKITKEDYNGERRYLKRCLSTKVQQYRKLLVSTKELQLAETRKFGTGRTYAKVHMLATIVLLVKMCIYLKKRTLVIT